MIRDYAGLPIQAFAIDVWDGAPAQAQIFPANAGITFPFLLRGAQGGILANYNTTYHYYFIIDGSGTIAWRGSWDEAAMRTAIDQALAPLPVANDTWGGVRALYR